MCVYSYFIHFNLILEISFFPLASCRDKVFFHSDRWRWAFRTNSMYNFYSHHHIGGIWRNFGVELLSHISAKISRKSIGGVNGNNTWTWWENLNAISLVICRFTACVSWIIYFLLFYFNWVMNIFKFAVHAIWKLGKIIIGLKFFVVTIILSIHHTSHHTQHHTKLTNFINSKFSSKTKWKKHP